MGNQIRHAFALFLIDIFRLKADQLFRAQAKRLHDVLLQERFTGTRCM